MVAVVNCTSVTVAVHIGFGHEPGGAVGAVVVTSNWYWPFLGVGTGPVVPVTLVVKVWPGATFPPGLVHSTIAVPGAETLIVNVVSPRPATLPVHCTCVPMSVQVGVPTKCPACAGAAAIKDHSGQVAAQVVAWPPLANADYGVGRSLKTRDSLVRPGEGVKTCREKTGEIAAYRYQSRRGQCD